MEKITGVTYYHSCHILFLKEAASFNSHTKDYTGHKSPHLQLYLSIIRTSTTKILLYGQCQDVQIKRKLRASERVQRMQCFASQRSGSILSHLMISQALLRDILNLKHFCVWLKTKNQKDSGSDRKCNLINERYDSKKKNFSVLSGTWKGWREEKMTAIIISLWLMKTLH